MTKLDLARLKVLVVEDHEPTRKTTAAVLEAGGFGRVACVADVAGRYKLLRTRCPT